MNMIPFPYRPTHDAEHIRHQFSEAGRSLLARLPKTCESRQLAHDFNQLDLRLCLAFGALVEDPDDPEGAIYVPGAYLANDAEFSALWREQVALFCRLAAAVNQSQDRSIHPHTLRLVHAG